MIGNRFWSTGITVRWLDDGRVHVSLDFHDDGFAEPGTVEGKLRLRYYQNDLAQSLDTLIADAERLGIEFLNPAIGKPSLYVHGDGESDREYYPSNWRDILAEQAARLGWHSYLEY